MNDDLISRSALLADAEKCGVMLSSSMYPSDEEIGARKVISAIIFAPAVDAVEVVRCAECEKRKTIECALSYFVFDDFDVEVRFIDVPDDFYCPHGERRTE